MDDRRRMAESARALPNPGTQQAFGSEQHHLGVVGDSAQLAEHRGKIPNAPLTELVPDARPIHKFHCRAQCITSSTGQQATADSIQLIHWNALIISINDFPKHHLAIWAAQMPGQLLAPPPPGHVCKPPNFPLRTNRDRR